MPKLNISVNKTFESRNIRLQLLLSIRIRYGKYDNCNPPVGTRFLRIRNEFVVALQEMRN